jgi:hypothetical protein
VQIAFEVIKMFFCSLMLFLEAVIFVHKLHQGGSFVSAAGQQPPRNFEKN